MTPIKQILKNENLILAFLSSLVFCCFYLINGDHYDMSKRVVLYARIFDEIRGQSGDILNYILNSRTKPILNPLLNYIAYLFSPAVDLGQATVLVRLLIHLVGTLIATYYLIKLTPYRLVKLAIVIFGLIVFEGIAEEMLWSIGTHYDASQTALIFPYFALLTYITASDSPSRTSYVLSMVYALLLALMWSTFFILPYVHFIFMMLLQWKRGTHTKHFIPHLIMTLTYLSWHGYFTVKNNDQLFYNVRGCTALHAIKMNYGPELIMPSARKSGVSEQWLACTEENIERKIDWEYFGLCYNSSAYGDYASLLDKFKGNPQYIESIKSDLAGIKSGNYFAKEWSFGQYSTTFCKESHKVYSQFFVDHPDKLGALFERGKGVLFSATAADRPNYYPLRPDTELSAFALQLRELKNAFIDNFREIFHAEASFSYGAKVSVFVIILTIINWRIGLPILISLLYYHAIVYSTSVSACCENRRYMGMLVPGIYLATSLMLVYVVDTLAKLATLKQRLSNKDES